MLRKKDLLFIFTITDLFIRQYLLKTLFILIVFINKYLLVFFFILHADFVSVNTEQIQLTIIIVWILFLIFN